MEIKLFGKKISIKNELKESLPALSDDTAWQNYLGGKGYFVSTSTALKVAVVIRCADVVAKSIASLGCHLYEYTEKGKKRAVDNSLYKLLRTLPNPDTTAYEFWHMYVFNLMLTSGAYAKIVRDNRGKVKEIWNIPTSQVRLSRNQETGERYLIVNMPNGQQQAIYDFMFTAGLRFDNPDNPEDFMRIASDVLGLTMNLNGYAKNYFENGSNLGGFVEYPNNIDAEQFKRFKEDWQKAYSGVMNNHKWALLEGGFKITKMESNPSDAQALESRKFQILEVCRLMGVTPHKVFSLDGASYNSIEQLNIEYYQETINPMDERLSQTIHKDILIGSEQDKYFAKFNTNKLLKGDTATRTSYYNMMRQNGILNANEIRDLEDMNMVDADLGGDAYLCNGNLITMANAMNNLPKSMQKTGG